MKMKKKRKILICIAIACTVIIMFYKVGNRYWMNKKYEYIILYLNNTYHGEYTINKCNFTKSDIGIMAGRYMYDFAVSDSMGNHYVVTYNSYWTLSEQSVEDIKVEKK